VRYWIKTSVVIALVLALLGALTLGLYGVVLSINLALPKSEEHPPLLIYGAPYLLAPGMRLDEAHLLDRLDRLNYRVVDGEVRSPGDYHLEPDHLDIFVRGFPDLQLPATMVRLGLQEGQVPTITSLESGDEVFPVSLEPQLISGMRGSSRQVREWLPLATIPSDLVEALLLIEDRRFYTHPGIDPAAVGRAVWANLTKGGVVQGGSTITQQLAKNLFYSPQRTWTRKVKESIAALVLEAKYRKTEILESYLNEIYLGQVGSVSVYGVGEAARRFFGKSVQELSIEDIAMIVGMVKGPNTYSPLRNASLAKERRDVVLGRLKQEGRLSEAQWAGAVNRPVRVVPPQASLADAPYFVDYLLYQSEEMTGRALPDGAKIYTSLDPVLQRLAQDTLSAGLAKLETAYPALKRTDEILQGALVALDARTGGILSMVGGRDYRVSQFNRAIQAKRQPGSLFKPLVYLAAFEMGKDGAGQAMTPASLVADEPVTFESGKGPWSPQNYDRQFRGNVTFRTALEQSLNVPAVRIAQRVGAKRIVQVAHDLGIKDPLAENLSIALGSTAVSLLDITSAYGALAQGGVAIAPMPLREIVSSEGAPLWHNTTQRHQVVSKAAAYLVTSLLKGVVERGTAAKAKTLGLRGPVAGKTGTTDGYRDAWFVGYTPDVVIGVWVGFDDEQPIKLTGSQAALPIWTEFARQVIPAAGVDFEVPSGVVSREVDPQTGQLATSKCPERVAEVFIEGSEPTTYCEVHGEGFWERLKHSFGFF
jgi:penicillin-binding protein 1B